MPAIAVVPRSPARREFLPSGLVPASADRSDLHDFGISQAAVSTMNAFGTPQPVGRDRKGPPVRLASAVPASWVIDRRRQNNESGVKMAAHDSFDFNSQII